MLGSPLPRAGKIDLPRRRLVYTPNATVPFTHTSFGEGIGLVHLTVPLDPTDVSRPVIRQTAHRLVTANVKLHPVALIVSDQSIVQRATWV